MSILRINNNLHMQKMHSNESFKNHILRIGWNYQNKTINPELTPLNEKYDASHLRVQNNRKNGVEAYSFVFGIEKVIKDNDFKESNEFLKNYMNDFKNKFFKEYDLTMWAIHNDETNPHIHFEISAFNKEKQKFDAKEKATPEFVKEFKKWEKEKLEQLTYEWPSKYEWREKSIVFEKIRKENPKSKDSIEKMKQLQAIYSKEIERDKKLNPNQKINEQDIEQQERIAEIMGDKNWQIENALNKFKEQEKEQRKLVREMKEKKREQEIREQQQERYVLINEQYWKERAKEKEKQQEKEDELEREL